MQYKFLSLFSGGLDSFIATSIHRPLGRGLALYIKMYHDVDPTISIATHLAQALDIEFTVRECFLDMGNADSSYIPQRNLIFLGIAYHVAELHDIPLIVTGLGSKDDNNKYPDTSAFFVQEVSKIAVSFTTHENVIQVVNPVAGLSKIALLRLARKLGTLNLALKTSSCYSKFQKDNDWGRGCGNCSHCQTRKDAFKSFTKKTKEI